MKSVKLILILAMVFVKCYSSKLHRSERKNKVQDGSGSWDTGYDCPGIQISLDNGKTWTAKEKVFIKPKEIVDETNTLDIGINFTFSTNVPSDTLKKVLSPGNGSNIFILPYRTITGSFSWSNPNYDNKYIQGSVTNDLKVTYQFKLLLPYKTVGWYINDTEMAKLCELINKKRNIHISAVQNAKSLAESAAGSYISNKPFLEEANTNAGNASALKASAQQQLSVVSTKIDSLNTIVTKSRQDIATLEAQLADLKSKYNNYNNELNSLANQKIQLESTISSAGNDAISYENAKKEIMARVSANIDSLGNAVKSLSTEVPPSSTSLDNGKNEVITNKNSLPLKTSMNNIQA